MNATAATPMPLCAHCGLPVRSVVAGNGELFCCAGCRTVSRLMGSRGEAGRPAWALFRVGVAAILSMEVMMISILLYTGEVDPFTAARFRWFLLGLSAPVMLLVTLPFLRGGLQELSRRRPGLELLIAAGSSAAFVASAAATIRGRGPLYYDTATMLPVLVGAGKLLEGRAKRRAADLLRLLDRLLPDTAHLVTPEGVREVPLSDIRAGERVRVAPGTRIPVDGVVAEGAVSVIEAAFTGEALPRRVMPGDAVFAGTVAEDGAIVVETRLTGPETLVSRIGRITAEAASHQPAAERLAERAGALLVPVTVVVAAGAAAWHYLVSGPAAAGMAALAVLVVSCPCSMGIAAPLATAAAVGRAARNGIVVRGGDILESLGAVGVVCFDKTGTITESAPRVARIELIPPASAVPEVLAWLAPLEAGLPHPVARAVTAAAAASGAMPGYAAAVKTAPGGVRGRVTCGGETREVAAGTEEFVTGAAGEGAAVVVAFDGIPQARLHVEDTVRSGAPEAVAELRTLGLATVLLSGDAEEAMRSTASACGFESYRYRCFPEEKSRYIAERTVVGERVAMVGDGINDGPALAAAEVGIALGSGADLARGAGNVLLLGDDLHRIPWLVALGRRTRRIILQNLAWGIGYNCIALGAAAAGLLHPVVAAAAMGVSSVTVLGNSLRLHRFPEPPGEIP